jgi:hypothetical protein
MSYTFSNEIKYADSENLDAFGRLRVSNITSLIELKHTHDKLPLLVDEVVSGSATSVYDKPNSQVIMTVTGSGGYVIRQTKSRGIYQPGKGQIVEGSFGNFALETDVIKRIGYFQGATAAPYNSGFDGFFLESNGSTGVISFQMWHYGSQVLNSPSTSWSTTDYDVAGIDWTKTQLLEVDFQWLGVGRLRFGMVVDGTVRVFETNTGANDLTTVYMQTPNQPIRYEIRSVGGTGSFNMICSQVSLEGTVNNLQKSVFLDNFTTRTLSTAGTKYPLLGYRINSGYGGTNITLSDIQTINVTNSAKGDFLVTIELNPVLSSTPAFNTVTNSAIEYSLGTGAQTVTTDGYRLAGFLGSGSAIQVDSFQFEDNVIRPGVSIGGTADQVWICITCSNNNQDFRTAANISYFE